VTYASGVRLQWGLGCAAAFCLLVTTLQGQEAWERDHEAGAKAAKAAQFVEAEGLLLRSADEARKAATVSPLLARSLLDLGEVYRSEGKYAPAQSCYGEALQIYTRQYGADSPQAAEVLNGQAELYKTLNDYVQAEPLLLKALDIRQKKLPQPDLATAQRRTILVSCIPPPEPTTRPHPCCRLPWRRGSACSVRIMRRSLRRWRRWGI
jgi:tetratricopeptide (TPR) repeat protein